MDAGSRRTDERRRTRGRRLRNPVPVRVSIFYTISGTLDDVRSEFDPVKSTSNLTKHGIDFERAQALCTDENYLEVLTRTIWRFRREHTTSRAGSFSDRSKAKSGQPSLHADDESFGSSPYDEHEKQRSPSMKAHELDAAFDDDVDITEHLDVASSRRPRREVQRVNVDFPAWMVSSLDAEASRLGVTRQAVIKTWIAERLDRRAS